MSAKKIQSELQVEVQEAITPEAAKNLLGWTEVPQGEEYTLRDATGQKVRLMRTLANRPFRMTLAKRYANDMLRGKWALNGETIVIDKKGMVQSGQHRLAAVVLAEQERQKEPDRWGRKPITIPGLIVKGIDDRPETVDTLDIGQSRSLGDVLFRDRTFRGHPENKQKKLANILAGATRLVWIRQGGRTVSDAPHFPHSEALEFLKRHPRLTDAVNFFFEEDGEERRISTYVSLAYAAGLLYLMGVSGTDPDSYQEEGSLDYENWDHAEEFWVMFADGSSEPFKMLRHSLIQSDASGGNGRDEILAKIVTVFNAWIDEREITAKDIKLKKTKGRNGKLVLAEHPRIGGIDVEVVLPEPEPEPEPEPKPKMKKKKTKKRKVRSQSDVPENA